ncbi:hypothetical protein LTR27_002239 [Elasticomyces elasticus]|nr:hypothetical protein LTR27_002239 [Elasticomyces elasticus]
MLGGPQKTGLNSESVRVDAMHYYEARSLLLRTLGVDGASDEVKDTAGQIIADLDKLPLAVDLAGARIRASVNDGSEVLKALQEYLKNYHRQRDDLLHNASYRSATAYEKTLWTVWENSLASLCDTEAAPGDLYPVQLLAFLTCFNRSNIQDELFQLASYASVKQSGLFSTLPTWLRNLLLGGDDQEWDDFYYRETLEQLLRFGLWYAIVCVAACYSMRRTDDAELGRHILCHLPSIRCLLAAARTCNTEHTASVLFQVGLLLEAECEVDEAEDVIAAALELQLKRLGEEHLDTLASTSKLADIYCQQGRLEEAEALQLGVWSVRSKLQLESHPDMLETFHNLAHVYVHQDRFDEAEELQLRVTDVWFEQRDDTDYIVMRAAAALAMVYRQQGKLPESAGSLLRALDISSNLLGEEHPDSLTYKQHLALAYLLQERMQESEEIQQHVVEARSRILGREDHESVVAAIILVTIYAAQEKWTEAEDIMSPLATLVNETLGREHADTLCAMDALAAVYFGLKNWERAEEIWSSILQTSLITLGEEHFVTLGIASNLTRWYSEQNRYAEAEELGMRNLQTARRVFGEEHIFSQICSYHLAESYKRQGRLAEAAELDDWQGISRRCSIELVEEWVVEGDFLFYSLVESRRRSSWSMESVDEASWSALAEARATRKAERRRKRKISKAWELRGATVEFFILFAISLTGWCAFMVGIEELEACRRFCRHKEQGSCVLTM